MFDTIRQITPLTALPWIIMWVMAPAPLYIWAVLEAMI